MEDWDKLRIFNAVAEAGSFTRAGELLELSQSAISRQINALEISLQATLFRRHARGLTLTEQGELLYRTTQDMMIRLSRAEMLLRDAKEKPRGEIRLTATIGFGTTWLTPRINEFLSLYPDISVQLILDDRELDIGLREADVSIRIRPPTQPNVIQRKLFTVHSHLHASPDYVRRRGTPRTFEDLDRHSLIVYGDAAPPHFKEVNWLLTEGARPDKPRRPVLSVNNGYGLLLAVESGLGIAALPDFMTYGNNQLVQILPEAHGPPVDAYFVYAEDMRDSQRIKVFRDFLLQKVREWTF
jgi:DNA-binding transcriptional LysR family regulator